MTAWEATGHWALKFEGEVADVGRGNEHERVTAPRRAALMRQEGEMGICGVAMWLVFCAVLR